MGVGDRPYLIRGSTILLATLVLSLAISSSSIDSAFAGAPTWIISLDSTFIWDYIVKTLARASKYLELQ